MSRKIYIALLMLRSYLNFQQKALKNNYREQKDKTNLNK
ncbi:hypothetical protein Cs308_0058 [Candidatus Chlamydia sanziniae]|uniref:Uncharacterized protein n=1 Tax=Candidatus Chlamydia sanziniae TaxID=1806891 RepID=A0A1A9HW12_9CHLA|nr:hypothetical protein Cs308_0058 [Candidatus Chlamydia sanziniae]